MWDDKNSMRKELDDRGYLMAVLLIGMAVAAVWASVSLPAWRFQVQRERELELIFRGEQYARAIMLYYVKNNRVLPTDVDQLVMGHYLRKKFKDPISGKDFALVQAGGGVTPPAGSPASPPAGPGRAGQPGQQQQQGGAPQAGGITGVASTSQASSIIVYQNVQQHSLWQFTLQAACQRFGYNCFGQQNQQGGPGRGGDRAAPGRGGDRGGGPGGAPGAQRGAGRPGGGGPGRGGDVPVRGGGPVGGGGPGSRGAGS
jgi:hypothetical protein